MSVDTGGPPASSAPVYTASLERVGKPAAASPAEERGLSGDFGFSSGLASEVVDAA